MKTIVVAIVLLAVAMLATACEGFGITPVPTGQALACEDLIDERIVNFSFEPMSPNAAQAWIARVFGVQASDNGREGRLRTLYWKSDSKSWSMHLDEEEVSIGAIWEHDYPALSEVFRCAGDPEYYLAYLDPTPGPVFTQLSLWYPSKGLTFGALKTDPGATFDSDAGVTTVSYSRPGTVEDLILGMVVKPGSEQYNRILESVKPSP